MLFGRLLDSWNVDGILWAWIGHAGECRVLFWMAPVVLAFDGCVLVFELF